MLNSWSTSTNNMGVEKLVAKNHFADFIKMTERQRERELLLEVKNELKRLGYEYRLSIYGCLVLTTTQNLRYVRIEVMSKRRYDVIDVATIYSNFASRPPKRSYVVARYDDGEITEYLV